MLQALGVIGVGVFSYLLARPSVAIITHFSLFSDIAYVASIIGVPFSRRGILHSLGAWEGQLYL